MVSKKLIKAMQLVMTEYGLHPYMAVYDNDLGFVEGVAHELAHVLELGVPFEATIYNMDDRAANYHEASTLRIEHAAMQSLGIRMSMKRLWETANWRDEHKPTYRALLRSLTTDEEKAVIQMKRIIMDAIERGANQCTTS